MGLGNREQAHPLCSSAACMSIKRDAVAPQDHRRYRQPRHRDAVAAAARLNARSMQRPYHELAARYLELVTLCQPIVRPPSAPLCPAIHRAFFFCCCRARRAIRLRRGTIDVKSLSQPCELGAGHAARAEGTNCSSRAGTYAACTPHLAPCSRLRTRRVPVCECRNFLSSAPRSLSTIGRHSSYRGARPCPHHSPPLPGGACIVATGRPCLHGGMTLDRHTSPGNNIAWSGDDRRRGVLGVQHISGYSFVIVGDGTATDNDVSW